MVLVKLLWERWKVVVHAIANVQARILLSVFYFVVLAPFAIGVKLCADPLRLRGGALGGWLRRPSVQGDTLAAARRQF